MRSAKLELLRCEPRALASVVCTKLATITRPSSSLALSRRRPPTSFKSTSIKTNTYALTAAAHGCVAAVAQRGVAPAQRHARLAAPPPGRGRAPPCWSTRSWWTAPTCATTSSTSPPSTSAHSATQPPARVRPLAFCCSARITPGAHACPALPTHPTYLSSCPVSHPSSFLHSPLQLCNHLCGAARRRLGGHASHHALRVPHAAQGAQIRVRPAGALTPPFLISHATQHQADAGGLGRQQRHHRHRRHLSQPSARPLPLPVPLFRVHSPLPTHIESCGGAPRTASAPLTTSAA